MGASFRSKEQVLALAGCDYLTISPALLSELASSEDAVEQKLSAEKAQATDVEKVSFDEKSFRWALGEDLCGTFKLAEGISKFAADTEKLEAIVRSKLA